MFPQFHCSSKTMDDSPTNRKCFPWSSNHTNGKTRNVSWFFRLLHPLNRKRKINVISSVQEDQAIFQVSNEGQTMSKEEFDRVLQERVNSLINDQLRRRDNEINTLKNQVIRLTEDLDRLLSNPNIDAIIRQTSNSNLSQAGDKAGASCSSSQEQQPYYFGTGFYNVIRRYQNKKKADKNGVAIVKWDITGARPTPQSSAEAYIDPINKPSMPKFGEWN